MAKFEGGAIVVPITEKQIETEYVSAALDWSRKSKGIVSAKDRHLDRLFSKIQICAKGSDSFPPSFIYVGADAELPKLYGPDFLRTPPSQLRVPDQKFDQAVCAAYPEVAKTGEAFLSQVRAWTLGYKGIPVWVEYQRLIMPGSLASGHQVFLTFSKALRRIRDVTAARQLHSAGQGATA